MHTCQQEENLSEDRRGDQRTAGQGGVKEARSTTEANRNATPEDKNDRCRLEVWLR
jgi:hypothetical protein